MAPNMFQNDVNSSGDSKTDVNWTFSNDKPEIERTLDIFLAIANNNFDKFLKLLNSGSKSGDTLLHYAVRKNRRDVVEELLLPKWNIDIDAFNNKGETALHIAASQSNDELIHLLLKNHAKSDVKNYEDENVLSIIRKEAIQMDRKQRMEKEEKFNLPTEDQTLSA